MASFQAYLASLIKAADLNQYSFADELGVSVPFVNSVVKGKRRVPVDRLDDWATALKLSGEARQEFRERALLDKSVPEVGDLVKDLHAEIDRLRAEVERLKSERRPQRRR